ncbi:MAG: hypothetical protein FWE43_03370 [Streptococcaceae bacterium]|nr:hypothetical protein [Streptococcaceae bacterium]MCL2681504.1 hypothetical protein [Streptococcaceae bacterium]
MENKNKIYKQSIIAIIVGIIVLAIPIVLLSVGFISRNINNYPASNFTYKYQNIQYYPAYNIHEESISDTGNTNVKKLVLDKKITNIFSPYVQEKVYAVAKIDSKKVIEVHQITRDNNPSYGNDEYYLLFSNKGDDAIGNVLNTINVKQVNGVLDEGNSTTKTISFSKAQQSEIIKEVKNIDKSFVKQIDVDDSVKDMELHFIGENENLVVDSFYIHKDSDGKSYLCYIDARGNGQNYYECKQALSDDISIIINSK